jgi:hypothetical protein
VKRVAVLMLGAIAYAWWASGVTPFTTLAYVAVAVPAVLVVVTYASMGALSPRRLDVTRYYRARAGDAAFKGTVPWLTVLTLSLALEAVGLALGGRSHTVPTLSTMLDHLLVYHWSRWLVCLLWLGAGAWPLARLARRSREEPR